MGDAWPPEPRPAGPPATTSRRVVPWGLRDAVGAFVAFVLAASVLGGVVLVVLRPRAPSLADAVSLPLSLALLALSVVAWVAVRYPGHVRALFGRARPGRRDVAVGAGTGLAAFFVISVGFGGLLQLLVRLLERELPPVQQELQQLARDPGTAPLLLIGAAVAAPLAEELFFRGMLYPALRNRLPPWPAIGLSALAFAGTHFQDSLDGYLLVVLFIFPLGMMLAWLYERRGTIVVPMLAHAVYNLVQVMLLIGAVPFATR